MLNSELAARASSFPAGFRREYDAHVYFDSRARAKAEDLRQEAARAFANAPVVIGELVDRCVGPHSMPMFEINFLKRDLEVMLAWLGERRGPLTVLVHEVTGYDLRDHTKGAIWLGEPLQLDESRLDPDPITAAT